ncbi:hypothetical protein ACVWYF_000797 [Hymenobacter sp. UYAg731]
MKKHVQDFEGFFATAKHDAPVIGSLAKELLAKGATINPTNTQLYYAINELISQNEELTVKVTQIQTVFEDFLKNSGANPAQVQAWLAKLPK